MPTDPFPNTADQTLEVRLGVLFNSGNILVTQTDPLNLKEGLQWFNPVTGELKIYAGGKTWLIGKASVMS